MRFPLRDWIDEHPGCRYHLASSGMRGSIAPYPWPRRRAGRELVDALHAELADHLRVAPERLTLTHGATEANAWVLGYLRKQARGGPAPVLRYAPPEYPSLFGTGAALGFAVRTGAGPARVAVSSQPRNPEGTLWPAAELEAWAEGARHLLVDETFREFAGVPSLAGRGRAGLWATGTFTKFFGADDARVGFAVAPEPEALEFARYVGLLSDEVAPASAAIALGLLRRFDRVRTEVRSLLERNLRALGRLLPDLPAPVAPVAFDRVRGVRGSALAERCLRASVLVCPGGFFGDPSGVRLALTRRDAPGSLRAYARVRQRAARAYGGGRGSGRSTAPRG